MLEKTKRQTHQEWQRSLYAYKQNQAAQQQAKRLKEQEKRAAAEARKLSEANRKKAAAAERARMGRAQLITTSELGVTGGLG